MTDHPALAPTRRNLLAMGLSPLALGLAWPLSTRGEMPAPTAAFRIPGEFEPQAAIWLGYDIHLERTTLDLVKALSPYTPLKLLVPDATAVQRAQDLLGPAAYKRDISYHIEPLAMYYPRDGAVFAAAAPGQLGVVDFRWNQYGMPAWCRQRYPNAAKLEAQCALPTDTQRDQLDRAMAKLTGAAVLPQTLVMEGGGVESNGQGLLIVCEAMVRSRNPGLTRAQLQQLFLRVPGVRRVIWMPEGLAHDPHLRASIVGPYVAWGTGGHTDEFVRFADERTVLLAWPDDDEARRHPVAQLNQHRMQRNATVLAAARTMRGEPLKVIRLPMPRLVERERVLATAADPGRFDAWSPEFFPPKDRRREGDKVLQIATSSYLNFVLGNGVVVMPDYRPHGTSERVQTRVQRLIEQAFPGRDIRWVDAMDLNWLGGGLHCASLHEPMVL